MQKRGDANEKEARNKIPWMGSKWQAAARNARSVSAIAYQRLYINSEKAASPAKQINKQNKKTECCG